MSIIFRAKVEKLADVSVLLLRIFMAILMFFAGVTKFVGFLPIGTFVVLPQEAYRRG